MRGTQAIAIRLHESVPPDWYARSIRENFLQRFWHTTRFREVGKLVTPAQSVLDIGCADGTFTKVLFDKTRARKIIGIDVMRGSIEFAKKRFAKNKRMSFRVADAHNLPFKNNYFAALFCLEALEHVVNPLQVLQEINRVIKENGYAVILIPSENLLFRIVWWLWQMIPGKNIWQHAHLHNFSNGFLEELLEKSGFKITDNKKFLLGMLHVVKAVKR